MKTPWTPALFLALVINTSLAQTPVLTGGDVVLSDYQTGALLRLRGGTVQAIGTGATLSTPSGLGVSASGDAVWVADIGTSMIYRLSTSGFLSLLTAAVPGPARIAGDGDNAIVTSITTGQLLRVDPFGNVALIRGGFSRPVGIAVDPAGGYLVTEDLAGTLWRVSRDGSTATLLSSGLGLAQGVAVLSDGDYAVFSAAPDILYRVPRAGGTGTFITAAPLLGNPCGVKTDPDGGVYVTESGSPLGNRVLRVGRQGAVTVVAGNTAFPPSTNLEDLVVFPTLRGNVPLTTGPGATVNLALDLPTEGNRPYGLVASPAVFPGFPLSPTDTRRTPLALDPILLLTLMNGGLPPYTQNWTGNLDGTGGASCGLDLTSLPAGFLAGVTLYMQGFSVDGASPSGVGRLSDVLVAPIN